MSVKCWAKVKVALRRSRNTFGSNTFSLSSGGRLEMVIKIPGFTGELRCYMTEEEAEKWVKDSNKAAFVAAAEASRTGLYGIEEFTKTGSGNTGFRSVMMKAAARSFAKEKEKKEKDEGEKS